MGLEVLDTASNNEKAEFLGSFENYVSRAAYERGGFTTIPKRAYDYRLGFWSNFIADFKELNQVVIP